MKKEIITLALAAFALAGNAQILKNDLLKGYKEGDKLEKSVYNEKTAPIAMNTTENNTVAVHSTCHVW